MDGCVTASPGAFPIRGLAFDGIRNQKGLDHGATSGMPELSGQREWGETEEI